MILAPLVCSIFFRIRQTAASQDGHHPKTELKIPAPEKSVTYQDNNQLEPEHREISGREHFNQNQWQGLVTVFNEKGLLH
jgi:hypothetical protein